MSRMKSTHHTGEVRKTKKGHEFVIGKTDSYGTTIEFVNKNGPHRVVKLLNANGAAVRYATELKHKQNKVGEPLTATQAAYRMGYLQHSCDSAKMYCGKKGIPSKSKNKTKTPTLWLDV